MRVVWALLVMCCFGESSAQIAQERVQFVQPVTLMGYASGVAIEWKTAHEAEVDYYAIWRHANGKSDVVASLVPRGQRDTVNGYRYIDQTPFVHDLAYELRVVFSDGSYAQSERMEAQHAHSRRTRLLRALDSESLARLHITLESEDEQQVVLRIKTLEGRVLETYYRSLSAGLNDIEIDYQGWPAGYYSVELNDSTAQLQWLVHVDPEVPIATTRRVPLRT